MLLKELIPNIFLIENTFSTELMDKFHHFISDKSNGKSQPKVRINLWDSPQLLKTFDKFWFENIEDSFHDTYLKRCTFYAESDVAGLRKFLKTKWKDLFILNYTDGEYKSNPFHIDFAGFSFILCINDEYQGGEVLFPQHNFSYRLKFNEMIIFPGGYTHIHGINEITKGKRTVLVGQSLPIKSDYELGGKKNPFAYADNSNSIFAKIKLLIQSKIA